MAELADAHDSDSCGKPCKFESYYPHQQIPRVNPWYLSFSKKKPFGKSKGFYLIIISHKV